MPNEKTDRGLGYASSEFAESFRSFGDVIRLPRSGAHILRRPINDTLYDYIGLYPFLVCSDWQAFRRDVEDLRQTDCVSLVFVGDPFSAKDIEENLIDWPIVRKFKAQFIIEIGNDVHTHRSRNLRSAISRGRTRNQFEEARDIDEVTQSELYELYSASMKRLGAKGMQCLPKDALIEQLRAPGTRLFLTKVGNTISGFLSAYINGDFCHLHLIATDENIRRTNYTTYALFEGALNALHQAGCKRVNIGGPVGLQDSTEDGLYQFKSRWTDVKGQSLLCGQILSEETYHRLTQESGKEGALFFPAYRAP